MSSTNPISLSRRSSWPQPKRITAIRFDSLERLEPLDPRPDCNASAASLALGVLFGPGGSPVVFMVDRDSALQGDSILKVLSGETSPWASSPSAWKELITRVQAAIHSSRAPVSTTVTSFGDVHVDFESMEVSRMGERTQLTVQEFKTLTFFLRNPRRVISRDELLNEAWGYDNYPVTRTVDSHVSKLRQKLESDPANPSHFLTVHGAGYKFVP
jgi:DNA-binding response OmpR family regulator